MINCPYSVINATPLALDLFLLHPGNACRHPRIYLTRDVMRPMGTSRVDCVRVVFCSFYLLGGLLLNSEANRLQPSA